MLIRQEFKCLFLNGLINFCSRAASLPGRHRITLLQTAAPRHPRVLSGLFRACQCFQLTPLQLHITAHKWAKAAEASSCNNQLSWQAVSPDQCSVQNPPLLQVSWAEYCSGLANQQPRGKTYSFHYNTVQASDQGYQESIRSIFSKCPRLWPSFWKTGA